MFDHVVFGVSDYAASKAFFLKALEPLGVAVVLEGPLGVELSRDGKSSLCLFQTEEKPAHLHLARSEEHTSELQSLMRISYAVFCLKKKIHIKTNITHNT